MYVITLSSKLLITSSARCYRKHVLKCNTPYEYDTCHLMLLEKKDSNEKRDKGKNIEITVKLNRIRMMKRKRIALFTSYTFPQFNLVICISS